MPGHFNVANALAAFAAAIALGVDPEVTAAAGLAEAARVPGRFEPIDEGQGFAVLVDYAHTPDSLENVLRAARAADVRHADLGLRRRRRPRSRQASADGPGRRRALRPRRSSPPTTRAPRTPRRSSPKSLAGAREGDAELVVEVDRHAAIALALGRARPGDTVVIAGKGHEQGQEFEGRRKIPFDDREVAREELRKLGSPA